MDIWSFLFAYKINFDHNANEIVWYMKCQNLHNALHYQNLSQRPFNNYSNFDPISISAICGTSFLNKNFNSYIAAALIGHYI